MLFVILRKLNATKCFIDSDPECSRLYYEEFQGSVPEDNKPMLRLVIPISDIRGKHLMIKFPQKRINFKTVDLFLCDFFKGRLDPQIDIKSEAASPETLKKFRHLEHLTGQDYFPKIKASKKSRKDTLVYFYRSNLKRDVAALKKFNILVKKMKKLEDVDVNFMAYDVVGNAMMGFRSKVKSLPGLVLFKRDYDLDQNLMLTKANREKEVMLFLNDRLSSDYSSFFIGLNH